MFLWWVICLVLSIQFDLMETLTIKNIRSSHRPSLEFASSSKPRAGNESKSANATITHERKHAPLLNSSFVRSLNGSSLNSELAIYPLVLNPNATIAGFSTSNRNVFTWLSEILKPSEWFGNKETQKEEKCSNCKCGLANEKKKIVGGEVIESFIFPWITLLTKNNHFHCGGSLINSRYVLTAAHCTLRTEANDLSVMFLVEKNPSTKKPFSKKVINILRYYKYQSDQSNDFDIALLKLESDVPLVEEMRPICLPTEGENFSEMTGKALGWGVTKENGTVSSNLREVDVPILSNEQCRKTKYGDKITDNMLCAGYLEGGKDSCQGDSGGPLQVKNKEEIMVVGLVSFGEGCARKDYPGVYTRVNKFSTWIKSNTKDACYCP